MTTRIHPVLGKRFGQHLKAEREKRKLGQREFAALIGVSDGYVSLLETALRTPTLEVVELIARKLKKKDPIEMLK